MHSGKLPLKRPDASHKSEFILRGKSKKWFCFIPVAENFNPHLGENPRNPWEIYMLCVIYYNRVFECLPKL